MANIVALVRFKLIRFWERVFCPGLLYWLLFPIAAIRALFKMNAKALPLPTVLGRGTITPGKWQYRLKFYQNATLGFFPERLGRKAWLERCAFVGFGPLTECLRRGQPAILVCCHFGPVFLSSRWLQAAGIPSATLVSGRAEDRSYLNRLKDQASLFPEIPRVFFPHQLRELTAFLSAGNILTIAVDSPEGNQIEISVDSESQLRMATGPIRLAARYGARLFPCTILDEGRWRFRFELGQPVPDKYLSEPPDLASAGKHLADGLLSRFRAHPEQCSQMILDCIRPIKCGIIDEDIVGEDIVGEDNHSVPKERTP